MKVHKTIRIKAKLDKQIREIAEREQSSFNQVAEHLMEAGLTKTRETLGVSLFDRAIEKTLSRHFKVLGDRIARMVSRTLLESTTTRALVIQVLVQQIGADKARDYNQRAYRDALVQSKSKIEDLTEIMYNLGGGSHDELMEKDS